MKILVEECVAGASQSFLAIKIIMFQVLIHQGTELKKDKLKSQNEWFLNNIFDPLGNYCSVLNVCKNFKVSISRQMLAHQRSVKHKLSNDPIEHMTKK